MDEGPPQATTQLADQGEAGDRPMAEQAVKHPDEHTWHACATPPPADTWTCHICQQAWVWIRPPRPAACWTRRDRETP